MGFTTVDGHFFENEAEAEFHEAEMSLLASLAEQKIAAERFMFVVDNAVPQLRRYLDAREKLEAVQRPIEGSFVVLGAEWSEDKLHVSSTTVYQGLDGRTEKDTASVFEQPPSRSESVSNMGSGTHPEAVSDDSESDGVGSREHDA